jgi:hypothetical protein
MDDAKNMILVVGANRIRPKNCWMIMGANRIRPKIMESQIQTETMHRNI